MKCDKCNEEAVVEVEIGFRSIKVKVPLCEKHLKEWEEKTEHFREIHAVLTRG